MNHHESLSRLAAGDLPPDQAEALREQIASDPALARAWQQMLALCGDLAVLPESAPPAHLDAAILAHFDDIYEPVAAASWGSMAQRVAPWLLMAAALVFAFWPAVSPELILASGDQWVDGDAMVLAGPHRVEIHGRALVSVEPRGGRLRVPQANTEDEMNKELLMGALAGAVLTVAVYEGSAQIFPGDAAQAAIRVEAGESHTLGEAGPKTVKIKLQAPPNETPEQAVARLTLERDTLMQALSASKFEGAMVKGQLAAHQGDAIEWSDQIPKGFHPAAVEAGIDAFLADHDEIQLASLDCSEFPCIATFQPVDGSADPMDAARTLPGEYAEAVFGEGSQVMASVAQHDNGDGPGDTLISVAAVPAEGIDGMDWQTRTQYRSQGIAEEFIGDAAGMMDEDVTVRE